MKKTVTQVGAGRIRQGVSCAKNSVGMEVCRYVRRRLREETGKTTIRGNGASGRLVPEEEAPGLPLPKDSGRAPRKEAEGLLLHLCCAPDGTIPWPTLEEEAFTVTGYFYGGNIHPEEEYCLRLAAVRRLAAEHRRLVVEHYAPEEWFRLLAPLEAAPEGGERCRRCFRLQLENAAREALRRGCRVLCTTLTISPHKNPDEINRIGVAVAEQFGLRWLHRIWRKGNGFARSVEESRRLGLYRQGYCGCLYSRNERNEGVECS